MTTATLTALQELQGHQQWVCWKMEARNEGEKPTKIPYNPRNGRKAMAGVASTWASYQLARKCYQAGGYTGVGYELLKETGITAVDLDACIDENGQLAPWAREIVDLLNSYTEYSPSGSGLHIFVRGTIPTCFNRKIGEKIEGEKQSGIEMYDTTHFFTVTGKHFAGTPATIEDRQAELLQIHAQYATANKPMPKKPARISTPLNLSDSDLISKACAAANGADFDALWNGSTAGYGSQSEADLALCGHLAFWTGNDASRIDHLFRQSGLYRDDRWDRNARSGETYGEGTINMAIEGRGEVYNPAAYRETRLEKETEKLINRIQQKQQQGKKKPTYQITPHQVETKKILDYLEQNEWGDAQLFAEAFADLVTYDHTASAWYLWVGHYWQCDTTGQIRVLLAGVLGNVYLKAFADLNKRLAEIDKQITEIGILEADSLKDDYKQTKYEMSEISKRVKELRGAGRNKRVQEFIQSLMGITSDIWDTNPWLLATPNGVVDLRTGISRDGEPSDYIRTVAPTEWRGLNAACPRFEQFLHEIFGDRSEEERSEIIDFLLRYLGYGITGLTNIAKFLILFGEEGRNGKDTLLGTLKDTLGGYVGAISNDVFIAQDKHRAAGSATPHLCDLQGKRLVWGSETRQGDKLNIAQIKLLTGGGDISTRQLFGKQYAFEPSHKLMLMTNFKPHADARDSAFWERVALIEFNLRFVSNPQFLNERKADTALKTTLKEEASGILALLIRSCLKYQQEGLSTPKSIQLATGQYRESEDMLHKFREDCCIIGEAYTVGAKKLFEVYRQWCKDNNLSDMSGTRFGEEMSKYYQKDKQRTGWFYQGIGIISDDLPPDDNHSVTTSAQPVTTRHTAFEARSQDLLQSFVTGVTTKTQKSPIESDDLAEKSNFLAKPVTPVTTDELSTPQSSLTSRVTTSAQPVTQPVTEEDVNSQESKRAEYRQLYSTLGLALKDEQKRKKIAPVGSVQFGSSSSGIAPGLYLLTDLPKMLQEIFGRGTPEQLDYAIEQMKRLLAKAEVA